MHHRIVSRVVILLVALFVAAAALFTLAATARSRPVSARAHRQENPHADIERTVACAECHTVALGTVPVTHRSYATPTCDSCHRRSPRVLVPHSITMGDSRCLLCHGDPVRDHGIPLGHLAYETRECLLCHPVTPDRATRQPPPAGLSRAYAMRIPHPLGGFFEDCLFCHQIGGERGSLPDNHRHFEVEVCTECHRTADLPK